MAGTAAGASRSPSARRDLEGLCIRAGRPHHKVATRLISVSVMDSSAISAGPASPMGPDVRARPVPPAHRRPPWSPRPPVPAMPPPERRGARAPPLPHPLCDNAAMRVLNRIRRNHALEHATLSVLAEGGARGLMAGYSTSGGFWLVAPAPRRQVQEAASTALRRLSAGESRLAISPSCGTNFAVATLLAGLALRLVESRRGGQEVGLAAERCPVRRRPGRGQAPGRRDPTRPHHPVEHGRRADQGGLVAAGRPVPPAQGAHRPALSLVAVDRGHRRAALRNMRVGGGPGGCLSADGLLDWIRSHTPL